MDQERERDTPTRKITTVVHHIERFWKQAFDFTLWSK
jgi:hypothetical protein